MKKDGELQNEIPMGDMLVQWLAFLVRRSLVRVLTWGLSVFSRAEVNWLL